jgi:hypothetical protein
MLVFFEEFDAGFKNGQRMLAETARVYQGSNTGTDSSAQRKKVNEIY